MRGKYGLFKRKSQKGVVWYFWYRKNDKRIYKSTGKKTKWEAKEYVEALLEEVEKGSKYTNITLRDYSAHYFVWDECPHIRRLIDEDKSITRRHAKNQRGWLEKYVYTDEIANMKFNNITRANLIDFRSRILKKIGDKRNTVNKVMSVIKTIFKEAFFII